jgi:hypothetical protein
MKLSTLDNKASSVTARISFATFFSDLLVLTILPAPRAACHLQMMTIHSFFFEDIY